MRILILGGGRVGQSLMEEEIFEHWDITVIDNNPEVVEFIENYYDVLVEEGDARDLLLLERFDIDRMDAVVAVTSSDEINVIACLVAKEKGVPFTAARIGDAIYTEEYMKFAENKLGVDYAFNPSMIAAENINKRSAVDEEAERRHTAILVGGGRTSLFLSDLLIERGFKVTIVVNGEEERALILGHVNRKAAVVTGDFNDKHVLDSVDASKAGIFAAVTESEPANIMLAKFSDSKGVPYTAARASQSEIIDIGKSLGIDEIITPSDVSERIVMKLKSKLKI